MTPSTNTAARGWRVALAISAVGLVLFLGWTAFVRPGDLPPAFDQRLAETMKDTAAQQDELRGVFLVLTFLGGIPGLTCLAAGGVFGSLFAGRRELALGWLIAAAGGALVDLGLKKIIDRPRPPEELRDAAVTERNESYPSGHSMGSAVGFGMLGYALGLVLRPRGLRLPLWLGLAMLIFGIGWSRVFLRAHWFSDVVGGFAIGVAWLFLWIAWLERRRFLKAQVAPPASANSLEA